MHVSKLLSIITDSKREEFGFTVHAQPAILASLTFVHGTMNVWTSYGDIVANGTKLHGIGSVGSVGKISELTNVEAAATTITLNGIGPTLRGFY